MWGDNSQPNITTYEKHMSNVFIGRQAIYDRKLNVYAYELLFRNSDNNTATIDNPDGATSELIINALTEIGLNNIVDDKLAFINLTRNFVTGAYPIPGVQDRLVLEILEDIELDDAVLEGVKNLKNQGYTIALDDFIFHPHLEPLVAIADLVKLDLFALDDTQLVEHVNALRRYPIKLLAEKVETQAVYEQCLELGFDYFQGYFFCKPNVISDQRTPANRLALLKLLGQLSDPDVDVAQLEELISQDVSLSYRLLRYINSSHYATDNSIDSIKHAVMLLGLGTVRSLAYLIVVSSIEDKPFELFVIALIRAHMCELLSELLDEKSKSATYFTIGLFSVIDAMMDKPMDEVLQQLPLKEDICDALLQHKGPMGEALRCTIAYEQGEWDEVHIESISDEQIRDVYIKAIMWCKSFTESLETLRAA